MSKIRFVNAKGSQVFLNEKLANNPTYLKRHKLTRDEITPHVDTPAKPEEKKETKTETKVEVKTEEKVVYTTESLEDAKLKHKKLKGRKPHPSWDLEKVIEKINEELNKEN